MKVYKRLLGIIVSIVMLATMLPAIVFADPVEPEDVSNEVKTATLELGNRTPAFMAKLAETVSPENSPFLTGASINGTKLTISYSSGEKVFKNFGIVESFAYIIQITLEGLNSEDRKDNGETWLLDMSCYCYGVALKPIENYSSKEDVYSKDEGLYNEVPNSGETYYALWAKPVKSFSATITAPKCGTEVISTRWMTFSGPILVPKESNMKYKQNVQPEVTFADKQCSIAAVSTEEGDIDIRFWVEDKSGTEPFDGKMTGGNTYSAMIGLTPRFGYFFDSSNPPIATINGRVVKESDKDLYSQDSYNYGDDLLEYVVDVNAEHLWDSGQVTKEATYSEDGVMTYTCSTCKTTKTEVIPKKAMPGIVTKGNVSAKTANLSWPKMTGAVSYKLSYRLKGGKWKTKTVKKNSCKLKKLKRTKLYEFKVAPVFNDGKTGDYSAASYLYLRSLKGRAKGVKRGVKLTWPKDSKASGYIVSWSTSKKMKNSQEIALKGKKRKSYTFKGLKKGKAYYVTVCPYVDKGGHRYLGVASKVKKAKAK